MHRANHSHAFARHSPRANFLAKDKKGHRKLNRVTGAIHARLMYQGVSGLRGQNFALFFVHANIRVRAQGHQGH